MSCVLCHFPRLHLLHDFHFSVPKQERFCLAHSANKTISENVWFYSMDSVLLKSLWEIQVSLLAAVLKGWCFSCLCYHDLVWRWQSSLNDTSREIPVGAVPWVRGHLMDGACLSSPSGPTLCPGLGERCVCASTGVHGRAPCRNSLWGALFQPSAEGTSLIASATSRSPSAGPAWAQDITVLTRFWRAEGLRSPQPAVGWAELGAEPSGRELGGLPMAACVWASQAALGVLKAPWGEGLAGRAVCGWFLVPPQAATAEMCPLK